ncbi:MAG: hypothetical protein IJU04_05025, partial [Ruminococcus sp.]|nr:hypothetical protein [Ruminococcus sp.]
MKKNKKLLSLALGLTMVFYSCFSALFTAAMPIEELFDKDNPTDPTVHLISSSVIEVTLDKSEYEYTGSQITPEVVSVHYESGDFDMDLVYEEDYTCEFGENVDIGTGTVKIVGSNNSEKDNVFWGSVTVEFDIVEAAESSEVIDESSQIEDESS